MTCESLFLPSPCFILSKFCGELAPDKKVPWEQINLWRKCFKNYDQVFVASKSVFNSTYSVSSQMLKI